MADGIQETNGSIPSAESIEAYRQVEGELLNIPMDRLRPLRYPAGDAAGRGLHMASFAMEDRAKFEELYREPPLQEIDSMRIRALAVVGAAILSGGKAQAVSSPEIAEAYVMRDKILSTVRAVCFGDTVVLAEIKRIEQGRGHQDLGRDLIDGVALVTPRWEAIAATNLLTQDDINRANALGAAILAWSRRKDNPKDNSRLLEQRAWTYLAQAYEKIRDYAHVIYRDDPALWEQRYPSLFSPAR